MAISRDTAKDAGNGASSVTSLTVSAPGGTFAAGKLLISGCFIGGDPATLTIPSGWTLAKSVDQFQVAGVKVAYKENSAGSETGAVWTCSPAADLYAVAHQYSGAVTSSSLDKSPTGTHSNGSQVATLAGPATGTLTQAAELVFSFLGLAGQGTSPSCAGGGALATNQSNRAFSFDQIVAATTTITHTPSWTSNQFADVITLSFKATTAGVEVASGFFAP